MKIVLKVLLFPVVLIIDLFTWVAVGMLSCSSFAFALAGSLLSILAFAVMLTCSVTNGFILLGFAFLVSPMGLPLLATKMLGGLQAISMAIRGI